MRAKGNLTNTHYADVGGRIILKDKIADVKLTVRFTSDSFGETISIADDKQGLMLVVPFERVEQIIKDARAEKTKGVN